MDDAWYSLTVGIGIPTRITDKQLENKYIFWRELEFKFSKKEVNIVFLILAFVKK